jgi:toxin YhaV
MHDRRSGRDRRGGERRRTETPQAAVGIYIRGWAILAHPLFLDQMERLVAAVEAERQRDANAPPSANAKLLGHLLDLGFEKIPSDPSSPAFRYGGALGEDSRHWFRGKTGNGRYRLFFRYHSASKLIVLTWVNDEQSLRTYGSDRDAYAVFADMLHSGNPPEDWEALVRAAGADQPIERMHTLFARHTSAKKPK